MELNIELGEIQFLVMRKYLPLRHQNYEVKIGDKKAAQNLDHKHRTIYAGR